VWPVWEVIRKTAQVRLSWVPRLFASSIRLRHAVSASTSPRERFEFLVLERVVEAVAAQYQAVALEQRQRDPIDRRYQLAAEAAQKHPTLGMRPGSLGSHHPHPDLVGDHRCDL